MARRKLSTIKSVKLGARRTAPEPALNTQAQPAQQDWFTTTATLQQLGAAPWGQGAATVRWDSVNVPAPPEPPQPVQQAAPVAEVWATVREVRRVTSNTRQVVIGCPHCGRDYTWAVWVPTQHLNTPLRAGTRCNHCRQYHRIQYQAN